MLSRLDAKNSTTSVHVMRVEVIPLHSENIYVTVLNYTLRLFGRSDSNR